MPYCATFCSSPFDYGTNFITRAAYNTRIGFATLSAMLGPQKKRASESKTSPLQKLAKVAALLTTSRASVNFSTCKNKTAPSA